MFEHTLLEMRRDLETAGVHFLPGSEWIQDGWKHDFSRFAMDAGSRFGIAADAQPTLATAGNAGVPAFLANLIDPEVVRIIFQPMQAAIIYGEEKKGDWTLLTTQFPVVEPAGQVTSYGDWNNDGNADVNINWVPRQSYHFQTIAQWGERQLDIMGLGKINYAAEIDRSAAFIIAKFLNKSYFFGIANLANYGALNDPNLITPISPTGSAWSSSTSAQDIYNDVLKLYKQLLTQMGGNTSMDAKMTLALSFNKMPYLHNVSTYNVTALQTIQQNFPNLRVVGAAEFATTGGELMQMILDDVEGQKTTYGAFTEKLRNHPVIPDLSAWKQKKSAGTWGWIGRYPIAIAQMLGI